MKALEQWQCFFFFFFFKNSHCDLDLRMLKPNLLRYYHATHLCEIKSKPLVRNTVAYTETIYEGGSIRKQSIPFSMDRDGHDFHALFQYIFYT